jgi:DNA-binding MarR family transcriptional regulator
MKKPGRKGEKKEKQSGVKTGAKNRVPISDVIRPLMKLRAKLDRIVNLTLRKEMRFGASQFRILMALTVRPDITQKEIAEYWDVTEAAVSRQVSMLEVRGWVTRKPAMAITPEGIATMTEARGIMDRVFERIFRDISDKKRKASAGIFEELISKL